VHTGCWRLNKPPLLHCGFYHLLRKTITTKAKTCELGAMLFGVSNLSGLLLFLSASFVYVVLLGTCDTGILGLSPDGY